MSLLYFLVTPTSLSYTQNQRKWRT